MRVRDGFLCQVYNRLKLGLRQLTSDRRGNIAITFGLISLPMLVAVGVSIDYARAYNVRAKMQSDLDAALIASIKEVDSLDEDHIKAKVIEWFDAQKDADAAAYAFSATDIVVHKSTRVITATASGTVPTTFLGLADIEQVPVSVTTSVSGPATSYLEVYLVLDKSASMMLSATTAGQTAMRNSQAGCVFACHTVEGGPWNYKNKYYTTNYDLAKAMGVTLRSDIAVTAAQEVLDMVSASDPTQSRIKVGLYSIGSTAKEVLKPNASMSAVKTKLLSDASGLTSASSQSTSYFDVSLAALTKLVGTAGDGSSAGSPLKLVLILSDGVQSNRDWVKQNNNISKNTTPLNPDWCNSMKTSKATVGVLYTQYLPMTWDWGYNETVGAKMRPSYFTSAWGGTIDSTVSSTITRLDYIPYALKACATSKDMFISAADSKAIEKGLSTLFQQYLGSVRLTQ